LRVRTLALACTFAVLVVLGQASYAVAHPTLAAAESGGSTPPIGDLLQYGALGLVVLGFVTGWIVPGPTAKALATENARLSALIDGKVFPILEQYAGTMEKAATALERSAEAMDRQAERERIMFDRREAERQHPSWGSGRQPRQSTREPREPT
jgi:hypothetical protein